MSSTHSDRLPAPTRGVLVPAHRTVVLVRLPRLRFLLLLLPALLVPATLFVSGSGYTYAPLTLPPASPPPASAPPGKELKALQKERARLQALLGKRVPRGKFLVIDRTNNRLYLRQDDRVLLEAVCSAGSGMILKEEKGGRRTWIFDTPQGGYRVLSKTRNPVWKKPDWAFVEEGKPIPKDPSERIEYGTLGEYASHFGNGYMIHGTLYERLLGRNVTHGCIRLGRDDLRTVYQEAPVGTPIFVY